MKKRFQLILAGLLLLTVSAVAQKPVISFPVKEYNFGQINEQDGKVTHVFEFTNTGNTTLVIQRVQASCGCTTPDWTKNPIEPGKKGTITATYDPQGRPGTFTKTVTVASNASNEMEVLTIKGVVIGRQQPQQQAATNSLPLQMGALKYSSKIIQINNVIKGKVQTRTLSIKNTSDADLKVDVANLPSYVTAIVTPSVLKAGQDGRIDFTFNSAKTATWGPMSEELFLVLNGKKILTDEYKVTMFSNIVEDFSKQTIEEKRNSPILEIKSPNVYLGEITKGQKVRGKIVLKNNGRNSLEIRRIVNNNIEVLVHPMVLSVKGGKTGELKIDINTKDSAKGEYKRIITMQTNDPQNSYVVFNLSWVVK